MLDMGAFPDMALIEEIEYKANHPEQCYINSFQARDYLLYLIAEVRRYESLLATVRNNLVPDYERTP